MVSMALLRHLLVHLLASLPVYHLEALRRQDQCAHLRRPAVEAWCPADSVRDHRAAKLPSFASGMELITTLVALPPDGGVGPCAVFFRAYVSTWLLPTTMCTYRVTRITWCCSVPASTLVSYECAAISAPSKHVETRVSKYPQTGYTSNCFP